MGNFIINGREVGENHGAYIIAEGCDNHLGDISLAKKMILEAKSAGADAIKFQHHLPDEEMLPDVPMSNNFDEPLYEFLKKYSLPIEQHRELKSFCDETGITYLCTPFSWEAAKQIVDLVPAFKIGSGEMTDIPSLERIAQLGKPMIISTGMSVEDEITRTYEALQKYGVQIALLNCTSEYPPAYEDINLRFIQRMRDLYPNALIGHSDHTPDLYTCFAAVAFGAKILEKHVILDKQQPGPDQSVSIDFDDLKQLVDGVRKIELAMGSKKSVHEKEEDIRSWAFRSLVSTRKIPAGTVIRQEDVWSKRPGTGIPSHRMGEVIGRKAKYDIQVNELLSWDKIH